MGHHTCTAPKLSATSQNPSSPFESSTGPPGTRFGEIRRFEELDSTNRYLLDEALAGAAEGLVVVADHQSAGRGRLGRRWEAPPRANLLVSVLLRPHLDRSQLHLVTVVVALAAADACTEVAGLHPDLKWPNDLYVGHRKLAGILAETVGAAVVVGLGLNVRWPAPESEVSAPPVPAELEGLATSIWRECDLSGSTVKLDPLVVLDLVLAGLEHRVRDLDHADGRRRQAAEYRQRCVTVGRRVRASTATQTIEGAAVDVTDEGHLTLETDGGFVTIVAGDVVSLD